MAEVFLEWDRDRVVVARGRLSGGKPEFDQVDVLSRPADVQDTLSLVQGLEQIFGAKSGRKPIEAVVVFPRQAVTIHRIQLPQVADSEIPDMLRLQAAMKLTVPVESVCMDFTPLPVQPGSPTRDVLLVTVPSDQLSIVQRTLSDAGLQLVEARVSAYCIAQALSRAGLLRESDGIDVAVVMRSDFLELTLLKGGTVLYSHSGNSWSALDAVERTVRSELSRARMSAGEIIGDQKIRRVILLGSADITAAVSDQFSGRFDNTGIERVDPGTTLLKAGTLENLAAADLVLLAGALSGRTAGIETIDFVQPRKAPEKKDYRRAKILGGILAAVFVLAAVSTYRNRKLEEIETVFSQVRQENSEYRKALEAGEKQLELSERIGKWTDRDLEWLDEFVRLKSLMPASDRMYIDNIAMSEVPQNGVGQIRFEAWAKSDADVNELSRKLRESGYRVKPYEPEYRTSAASQDYNVKVLMEVVLPDPAEEAG